MMETVGDILDSLPAPRKEQAVAVTEAPGSLLSAIVTLAKDPSVDVAKLKELLAMQREMEAEQAKRSFIKSFSALSKVLPRVKKNGTIELPKKDGTIGIVAFAKWEDMDKVIRPAYTAHGFTLSFDSAPRQADGGGLVVTGELMHEGGHTKKSSMPLPLDTGPGRNNLQAAGSTLSYGKRYCAEMLLNIVREGADDDGAGSDGMELITSEQKDELVKLLKEQNGDTQAFLKAAFPRAKIETLDDIPAVRFADAKQRLEQRAQILAQKKTAR